MKLCFIPRPTLIIHGVEGRDHLKLKTEKEVVHIRWQPVSYGLPRSRRVSRSGIWELTPLFRARWAGFLMGVVERLARDGAPGNWGRARGDGDASDERRGPPWRLCRRKRIVAEANLLSPCSKLL